MTGVYAFYEERVALMIKRLPGDLTEYKKQVRKELVKKAADQLEAKLRRARRYYGELEEALREAGLPYLYMEAVTEEPLLVGSSDGLGYLLFEVGVSWDTVLDLPVIRGSAVKGAMRSLVHHYALGPLNMSAEEAAAVEKALFGSTGKEGSAGPLIFFDAYPVKASRLLEEDIVNPHYGRAGEGPRTELDVEPVPVPHLVVPEDVVFGFVVAVVGDRLGAALPKIEEATSYKLEGGGLLAFLLGAVMHAGLGGRSLKGYGSLRPTSVVRWEDAGR